MTAASSHDYFGATWVGPRHRAERRPNEDSWLGCRGPFGTLVVVSDGLGSRSEARRGAKVACRAVLRAVRAWHRAGGLSVDDLLERVETLWLAGIAPSTARNCAATCVFALAHGPSQLHVAALGDGMALVRREGAAVEWILGPRAAGFSNETAALGQSSEWIHRSFPLATVDVAVLATDGVADDLLPESIDAFVGWLLGEFAPLAPDRRGRALQRELREWPTPNHTDDKTLVVLVRQETPSS